ncbi:acyltransferase family protein [Rhizobium sp. RU20A]|uniref:acyltransferase family protein n=1 Tax=Rhizobium sp. RU20A TaxID=1907412 RepID=UPI00165EF729|nr:acyltransferase family protein [Rhizobium sp. RU20A]
MEAAQHSSGAAGRFRADINALRAIAVISVVAYHFGLPLYGGYVGVDIFFVISGFLMTGIVDRGLTTGNFSILQFLRARYFRIVPALLAMLLAVVAVGLLIVDPLTAEQMFMNSLYSLLFVSNMAYGFQNSYFAGASDSNWLLHTWSLSVEWQFYLLFPFVMIAMKRMPVLWKRRFSVFLISTVLLFAFCVVFCMQSRQFLQVGFFFLPTRAWELTAGGCIALLPRDIGSNTIRNLLTGIGLCLLAVSVFAFDTQMAWPSALTLLPVMGTALIIAAASNHLNFWNFKPAQTLGLWSYSIYLWHWPIIVFLKYFDLANSYAMLAGGFSLSIAAGAASYGLVEQRMRQLIEKRRLTLASLGLALACCAAFAIAGASTSQLEKVRTAGASPAKYQELVALREVSSDWKGGAACPTPLTAFDAGKRCTIGQGERKILVIGDSHAEQYIARYANQTPPETQLTFLYNVGCPPLPGMGRNQPGMHCASFTKAALEEAATGAYNHIVLIAAWRIYLDGSLDSPVPKEVCVQSGTGCSPVKDKAEFESAVSKSLTDLGMALRSLTAKDITVSVVLPYPEMRDVTAADLYKQAFLSREPVGLPILDLADYDASVGFSRDALTQMATSANANLFDPGPALCSSKCTFVWKNRPMFKDGHHFANSVVTDPSFTLVDPAILQTERE